MTAVLAIYVISLAYLLFELYHTLGAKPMNIHELAAAIATEQERNQQNLERMSDTELFARLGVPLTFAVILAAEHYMVVSELLRRAKEPQFAIPDDWLDTPCPSVGSTKVRIAD